MEEEKNIQYSIFNNSKIIKKQSKIVLKRKPLNKTFRKESKKCFKFKQWFKGIVKEVGESGVR